MANNPKRIKEEMFKLEKSLGYSFNDISRLEEAMRSFTIPKKENDGNNSRKYSNGALATVGDAILKAVLADYLFSEKHLKTEGEITTKKEALENNEVLHRLMVEEKLIGYAYNESHFKKDEEGTNKYGHIKVPDSIEHTPYLEAIIAAIYYDCGFEKTKKWILNWLLPKLEKYK